MIDERLNNLLDQLCKIDPTLTKVVAFYFIVEYHTDFTHMGPADMWWQVYALDKNRGSYSFRKYIRLRAEFFLWKERLLPSARRRLLACFDE